MLSPQMEGTIRFQPLWKWLLAEGAGTAVTQKP
jgi:hypothetical protein